MSILKENDRIESSFPSLYLLFESFHQNECNRLRDTVSFPKMQVSSIKGGVMNNKFIEKLKRERRIVSSPHKGI